MKVFYDSHTDTLSVILKDNVSIPSAAEPQPKDDKGTHRRDTEIAEFGVLRDTCFLGALRVSVVNALPDRTDTRKVDFQLAE